MSAEKTITIPRLTSIQGMLELRKILSENPKKQYVLLGVSDDAKFETRELMLVKDYVDSNPDVNEMVQSLDYMDLDTIFRAASPWYKSYNNLRHSHSIKLLLKHLIETQENHRKKFLCISLDEVDSFMTKINDGDEKLDLKMPDIKYLTQEGVNGIFIPVPPAQRK